MATASDIIEGALRKLGVRASETAISDAEMSDGLEDLNDLGESKRLFPAVASLTDEIRVPRGLDGALKLVLAEKLMPDYADIQMNPVFQRLFSDAWNDIWRITNGSIVVNFPNTVPLGTGNQDYAYLWDDVFFNEQQAPNF